MQIGGTDWICFPVCLVWCEDGKQHELQRAESRTYRGRDQLDTELGSSRGAGCGSSFVRHDFAWAISWLGNPFCLRPPLIPSLFPACPHPITSSHRSAAGQAVLQQRAARCSMMSPPRADPGMVPHNWTRHAPMRNGGVCPRPGPGSGRGVCVCRMPSLTRACACLFSISSALEYGFHVSTKAFPRVFSVPSFGKRGVSRGCGF